MYEKTQYSILQIQFWSQEHKFHIHLHFSKEILHFKKIQLRSTVLPGQLFNKYKVCMISLRHKIKSWKVT